MRTILAAAAVSALAAAIVLAATSSGSARPSTTIRLFEHDSSQANIDLGDPGDSPGDLFVVAGDLFDRRGGHPRGTLAAVFTTVSTGAHGRLLSHATFTLAGGEIAAQGTFTGSRLFAGKTLRFAITGGTGAYRDARGEGTIQVPNQTDAGFTLTLR